MKNLILSLGIIFFFGSTLSFAAEGEDMLKEMTAGEVRPLQKIEGRVSLVNIEGKEYLMLSTKEGTNYSLSGKLVEENIKPLKDIEHKQLFIAGLPSANLKEEVVINQKYDEKTKEVAAQGYVVRYTDFLVLYIEKIEDAQGEIVSVKKPYDKPLPPVVSAATLKRIRGKILARNFKSPIPTLEIKDAERDKPNTVIIINISTAVLKVIDGQVMHLQMMAINEGDEVEAWYEEKENQKTARMITVREKEKKK